MKIETTLNISESNLLLLKNEVKKTNIPMNKLIINLLFQYLNKRSNHYKTFSRIRYQKRNKTKLWKVKHVWFTPDFYEKCVDLRKFHKLSLSGILAEAIELYLEKISDKKYDNYHKSYIFISTFYNNCPIFIISWEYPGNKKTLELLQIQEKT